MKALYLCKMCFNQRVAYLATGSTRMPSIIGHYLESCCYGNILYLILFHKLINPHSFGQGQSVANTECDTGCKDCSTHTRVYWL